MINTIWCTGLWVCGFVFFLVKEVPSNDSLLTVCLHQSPDYKDQYGGFSVTEKHCEGQWGAVRGSEGQEGL